MHRLRRPHGRGGPVREGCEPYSAVETTTCSNGIRPGQRSRCPGLGAAPRYRAPSRPYRVGKKGLRMYALRNSVFITAGWAILAGTLMVTQMAVAQAETGKPTGPEVSPADWVAA